VQFFLKAIKRLSGDSPVVRQPSWSNERAWGFRLLQVAASSTASSRHEQFGHRSLKSAAVSNGSDKEVPYAFAIARLEIDVEFIGILST
jgi:hypothetical protein